MNGHQFENNILGNQKFIRQGLIFLGQEPHEKRRNISEQPEKLSKNNCAILMAA